MRCMTGLASHRSAHELRERYREADEVVLRTHLQVIYLLARGRSLSEVAEITGYSTRWLRTLIGRYNARGIDGLGDGRRRNAGAAPLVTAEQEDELRQALGAPPPEGGQWTGPKVARWIARRTGRPKIWDQRGWDYLKKLEQSLQVPRPRHARAAPPEDRAAFKKT